MGDLNPTTLAEEIGTLAGDTPLAEGGTAGELTFDNAGPTQFGTGVLPTDPMEKLHLPVLKQNTTTSIQVEGNGGGNPPQPGGSGGSLTGGGSPKGLLGFARKFLGVPYVWGGTSPNGFDCSGFTQYVYRQFGVNLPRISADQARAGKRIGLGDLKPGDMVAWDNSSRNNGADHIAIYLGNGLIIEAPRPGRSVQITRLYDTGNAWGVRVNFPGRKSKKPRRPTANPTTNKPYVYPEW